MYPRYCALACVFVLLHGLAHANTEQTISFVQRDGALEIHIGDQPFATYIHDNAAIPRPFFANVHAPNGTRVTRAFPPGPEDDHGDMHPGLWMSFGDLNGHDFWRNKARTEHVRYVEAPQVHDNKGTFAVENAYVSPDGAAVATEIVQYEIVVEDAFFLRWTSEFRPARKPLVFGDQEEMGLGVRLRPELSVASGSGVIRNDSGGENEAGVWGTASQYADYRGILNGEQVGVTIVSHPENFRRPWWHARDYGLLVANPFGRNAMTGGEKSAITVAPDEVLRLRYGIAVYSNEAFDAAGAPDLFTRP